MQEIYKLQWNENIPPVMMMMMTTSVLTFSNSEIKDCIITGSDVKKALVPLALAMAALILLKLRAT